MGCSKKDPYPTHRGNFRRPESGGRDCLKTVLSLSRMSREGGGGVLLISSVGGGGGGGVIDLLLEQPNKILKFYFVYFVI